jgi:PPOX class probable F420-dependent enzyme
MGFAAFAGHKYLSLETFKKSGDGVKTPVWFAADPSASLDSNDAKLYVYTIGVSGKVKRVRNNPRVKIAPCDMRGRVLGEWVEARAKRLPAECSCSTRSISRGNSCWGFSRPSAGVNGPSS